MTDLVTTPTIGGTPEQPGAVATLHANAQREYVAASGSAFYANYWRSLRWAFDDATQEFGDDLYERMLRDPQVLACVNVFKSGILEDGVQLAPAIDDDDDPQYERATEIADDCQQMLDDLNPALDDTLWDMLDGVALGCKVAEVVYGADMRVQAIKVKPRESTAFVVDVYQNVVGLLARVPGAGAPVQAGTFVLMGTAPLNLLPRDKFAVFTFRPKDGDPRGRSILRAAYNAWWLKMQTWPQYLKFLVQFGTPSLVGFTGPNANAYTPPGGTTATPQQQMVDTLVQFQNGTAAAFEHGAVVQPVDVAGSGVEAFVKAFDLYDRQITVAVLHQTLATMEGQHQARAASETHKTVLDTLIRQAKRAVCRMLRNDVLRVYVRFTYGEEAARTLTPRVTLGSAEAGDLAGLWLAMAQLSRANYLDPSQYPAIDELLNLPPRALVPTDEQQPNDPNADPLQPEEGDDATTEEADAAPA